MAKGNQSGSRNAPPSKKPKPGVRTTASVSPSGTIRTRREVQQGNGQYIQEQSKKPTPRGQSVTTTGFTKNSKGVVDPKSGTYSKTFQKNARKKPV